MDYLDIMLDWIRQKLAYLNADGQGMADADGYDPGNYGALAIPTQDHMYIPDGPYCYCPTQYSRIPGTIGRWMWQ